MTKLRHGTISKRTVETIEVEKDTVFWDRELTGFGVRAYASGAQGLCGADSRAARSEASDGRSPRGHFRGPSAQAGSADHRPRQGGRGADRRAHGAEDGTDGGRTRGAVSGGAHGGAL